MKNFMVLMLFTMSTTTWAASEDWFDSNKPVKCGPFRDIIKLITDPDFNEQPLWIGKSGTDSTQYVLFRNPNTGTWTLVQQGREIGCVLGMGKTEHIHDFDPGLANKYKH